MSEEVRHASITVPRSILISLFINGSIGFAMLIAELFCLQDPESLLAMGLQYPFIQIFLQSTRSTVGTALLVAINIFNQIGLNIGNVAAASRMLWSFSRDRGVPGWRYLNQVGRQSTIPLAAILATTIFSVLVGVVSIGSPIAFNGIISLSIDGLYASYLVTCSLLLWRRCTGTIKVAPDFPLDYDCSDPLPRGTCPIMNALGSEGRLIWGPFRMPSHLGIVVNAFACLYMIVILFFSVWPPVTPTTDVSMNYSVVMFSAVAILSTVYYILWARKTYTGPVVEISSDT